MVTMTDATDSPAIIYEGAGEGAELMGAEQANFFVPSLEREFAIFVNEPATLVVLGELSLEDTRENRELATRRLGELIVAWKIREHRLDPIAFVGSRVFDEEPALLEQIRQAA